LAKSLQQNFTEYAAIFVVSNSAQFCEVYRIRPIFMLANVGLRHRTVTITIITNCTRFTKPRYVIVKYRSTTAAAR